MLKENLMSILAALGEVQGNAKDEEQAALVRGCRDNLRAAAEQAEALENNLNVVSVDWATEEAEIAVPAMNLRLVARGISVPGTRPTEGRVFLCTENVALQGIVRPHRVQQFLDALSTCLLYTSPSPRDS